MKNFKDLIKYVKLAAVINKAGIPLTNGIKSRVAGSSTNKNDKQKEPTHDEYQKLAKAVSEISKGMAEFAGILKDKADQSKADIKID